ncbi:Arc family DNA-binding protein [Mesorhizobium sp. B2-4-7]|uniref:Arc family DNA-binding protein n=1 Tax=Mesorhizobium sp. B2-4-7 TaxID=2589942 RepID=UPI00112BF227|nr:Arc family DNA-binding protein [Mesorhizobium sp. B2-4-7]TPL30208.1 Arc family DNA-binding protein [Mesorhizobium sp. B2-4-7]
MWHIFADRIDDSDTISKRNGFGHKSGMPQAERPRFNLRLTPELKVELTKARRQSGRSMNAEILAQLKLVFEPDPTLQLAQNLRPLFDKLEEADRDTLLEHIAGAVAILAKGIRSK